MLLTLCRYGLTPWEPEKKDEFARHVSHVSHVLQISEAPVPSYELIGAKGWPLRMTADFADLWFDEEMSGLFQVKKSCRVLICW